jgi:vitamin B12 transporter
MKTFIKILFLLIALNCLILAQKKTAIQGTVKDKNDNPLPFVNIFLINSSDGCMSADNGTFVFNTSLTGKAILKASIVGYEKYSKEIDLSTARRISINIVLNEDAVKLKETLITASSYGTEKEKGLVISRLDVLTTPGGATDIYQSLKTLPGLTQVSESAELYVRGGEPLETITMINQSVMYHPFTFESSYGGIFSNLNQSVVKSMYFTSGGFSAKYGNALSGVLDIETKNQPESSRASAGVSLASGNVTAEIAIDPQKFGLYFDARQNFTKPIFWFNGGMDRLTVTPNSKNFTGGAVYNYSNTGRLKFITIYADDEQGVKVKRAEYNGTFNGSTKNTFLNIQNTDIVFNDVVMKNAVSFNTYSNKWLLGILDIVKTDYVYTMRSDFEIMLGTSTRLMTGGELENREIQYIGQVPEEDYNIRKDAKAIMIDTKFNGTHYGFYGEMQTINILGLSKLSVTAGVRYDNFTELNVDWFDPRMSIGYKIDDNSTLRLGLGIFRQVPDPRLFNPIDGNPELKSMKAEHLIGSYEYMLNDQNSFRIEVYRKNYKDLPLENETLNYDNSGYGYAEGIDCIFKGEFPFGIEGWISYGYISTKRYWMDYDFPASSSSDITHNIALVAKYSVLEKLQVGLTAKYASGRPFTPVESSILGNTSNIYIPIYAATNSSRYPDYKRIDLRWTYFDQLFQKYSLIVYIEGLNILNFRNLFGYSYSQDYKERIDIESYFGRRMLVFGFTVTI